jgi:hypothetical protein
MILYCIKTGLLFSSFFYFPPTLPLFIFFLFPFIVFLYIFLSPLLCLLFFLFYSFRLSHGIPQSRDAHVGRACNPCPVHSKISFYAISPPRLQTSTGLQQQYHLFLTATVTHWAPREVWGCNGGWSLRLLVMGLADDTEG